ncbi:hypothetical protein [Bartonella grahamii]|uniref:hypothetical protein n=1 Tax=Bartonella grahamii TaxID=33045 RepID=UPI0037CB758A
MRVPNIYEYIDYNDEQMLFDNNHMIRCDHFNNLPLRIQRIVLTPDNQNTQNIVAIAKKRLSNINFNSANSSGDTRNLREIQLKGLCGLIIEQLYFTMLNHYNTSKNVSIQIDSSNNSINQVDIKIIKRWKDQSDIEHQAIKTVEIRSSFPFKPIAEAIIKDFDILGTYTNHVKTIEMNKDFYLRFLFSIDYSNGQFVKNNKGGIDYSATTVKFLSEQYFDDNLFLKRDLVVYFVGGATKEMMLDDTISYYGSMQSNNFNKSSTAKYRKLKIKNALDCISIIQLMLNVVADEASNGK